MTQATRLVGPVTLQAEGSRGTGLCGEGQPRLPQARIQDLLRRVQSHGQAHQVLAGRLRKAAKALLGCLKASCWVYPAGKREVSPEEQGLSGGSRWYRCMPGRRET